MRSLFSVLTALFLMPALGLAEELHVFIGTYTRGKSEGIYRMKLNLSTGELSKPTLAAKSVNPSFLAIHPTRRFLYAVNETGNFKGQKTGAVSAFSLDPTTGELKFLNQHASEGGAPCHLVVDKAGRNVLVANYTGGSVAVLPIQKNGKLKKASCAIQHKGSSADPRRQKGPHAHSINLDAANRFAVAADLGLDKVLIYDFNSEKGLLTPNDPDSVSLAPRDGPRHFAFHPSGKFAYVINEMKSTVTAMTYDAKTGTLKKIQTLSTLPKGVKVNNSTAEVQVHPSGRFVYGSNRGHNSIVCYRVDQKTGKLTYVANQGSGIKVPRNFGIDPTGKYVLVASQAGNNVRVFAVDQKSGKLVPTKTKVDVPTPVCVKFMRIGK